MKMMKPFFVLYILICLLFQSEAFTQTPANKVEWSSFNVGFAIPASASTMVKSVAGQAFVGTMQQNYPNPFNPSTTIAFALPKSSTVALKLFDMFGRELATLAEGKFSAGRHQVVFDATAFSSGVYFYRLQANEFSQTRRLMLVK